MGGLKDMTGLRFGRLTVVELSAGSRQGANWLCVCDCGGQKVINGRLLRQHMVRSCGCLMREIATVRGKTLAMGAAGIHGLKHGAVMEKWPEYKLWTSIKQRCFNPNVMHFHVYGGKGITVCERWLTGENGDEGFENFIEDMGRRPSPDLWLRRIDRDGDYEPDNCVWACRRYSCTPGPDCPCQQHANDNLKVDRRSA